MKLKLKGDQRKMSVFALIARRLWKHFRLQKQRLHWYNSVKRCWMISLTGTLWGCTGYLDMLGYVEMKSPTSSQWVAPLRSLLDPCHPLGSLGGISIIRLNAGWINSIWQCDVVLVILRQAQKLILVPSPATKTCLLSFNRTQSRVVTGLLTRHNTLRRHL